MCLRARLMTSGTVAAPSIETAPSAQTASARPSRRLSRQVAADTVAIGDVSRIVFGGLLPAFIYAMVGGVQLDQVLLVQSTLVAGFITHLCLRFRGMYDTTRMDRFPAGPTGTADRGRAADYSAFLASACRSRCATCTLSSGMRHGCRRASRSSFSTASSHARSSRIRRSRPVRPTHRRVRRRPDRAARARLSEVSGPRHPLLGRLRRPRRSRTASTPKA